MLSYFAYGSNMLGARLRARVPSAQSLGVVRLTGYRLRFNKIGKLDFTAKCNVEVSPSREGEVLGVCYSISATDLAALDEVEGKDRGYARVDVEVTVVAAGHRECCFTYVGESSHIDDGILPFVWYKELVLAGGREHGLPEEYLRDIERVQAIVDPQPERRALHRGLLPGAS